MTVCANVEEVLVVKLTSALYTAGNECEATERTEVTKVATPPLNVFVASELVPSLKVTVPVGVPAPAPDALTLAVNTTDCPNTVGLVEEVNVVVVAD